MNTSSRPEFPIVGIGASAGGLEAFTQLLHRLPPDTGLGFVLIQHLDPTHPSLLGEVLAKATAMPVHQAAHGMRVEPNHVYVIVPNTDMAIHDGQLALSPRRTEGPNAHLPVDFFLRSLALELGSHAIGVILSGSASDGTDGLRAIRAEDGITFAQDPRSAKFPGMPQSAIDAGVVDHCLDAPQLADELVRLSRHPYERPPDPAAADAEAGVRDEILAHVRSAIGIDFSEFKRSTVTRRLARRVALRGVADLRAYLTLLDAEPDEIGVLYEDMLIHVTSFFRDPEVFESLRTQVFPEIFKHKPEGATVRLWVAGCSTGEEVYSLAIALLEFSRESGVSRPIHIFGSDLSEMAIQKARVGVYSDSAMQDVSEDRRKRYFSKANGGGHRINKSIRDLCVFVRHDLARDPPFSTQDLVSCRNVLIYFDQALQMRVLPTLHYCLNQPGFLVLGRSENVSGSSQLFSVADNASKIFVRTATASSLRFAPLAETGPPAAGLSKADASTGNEELQSTNEELETAKEELQSINEELTTLNDELQRRNQEVTQVNSDLLNFALAVDICILTLDMERRIRRFTPKARSLLNVMPSDVGRSMDDIKLNVDVPDLNQQIAEVIETASVKETEVQDKSGRWYRMQVRPYTTTDHVVDGVVLSLVDIHELKRLLAEAQSAHGEAERSNRAKDDFLATLSHELRTPLSSILLNAQRLSAGGLTGPADLQRAGASLERAALTQVRLIDDLLDVSRIVAGKLTLDCRPMDLCHVVRGALDGVGPLLQAKSIALEVSLDPEIEEIFADQARVHQVVTNLLSNAIKFTPHGGKVTVVVDAAAGFARLRVMDTGIGIKADFLPHVFASFSQSDSSITREYGGLGLGLALVRHIAELQGGSVRAESVGPGHGATFSVTFPLVRMPDRTDAEFALAPQSSHALDRPGRTQHYDALVDLRVLFVDDDLRTREAVLEVLQLAGARVELAASAAEGMTAIDVFKPQVILCDIAMPGEDGYTFMRKVRARESGGASIPALALTALAAADDRHDALAAGFQLHVAKPIDIDRLREAVLQLSKLASLPSAPAHS